MKTQHILFLAIAALSAPLSACSSLSNGEEEALSIAEAHPISVDSQIVTLTIDLDPTVSELKAIDKARLRAFADAYLTAGYGPLTVTAPSGAATDRESEETAADIRQYLYEQGVDWSQINGASYSNGEAKRELILSYTRYVATPSACGDWSGFMENDFRNLRSRNFGCATQNNLAAAVADPHHLVEPAAVSSADAQARIRALRAYRGGTITASETDTAIETEISN